MGKQHDSIWTTKTRRQLEDIAAAPPLLGRIREIPGRARNDRDFGKTG